MSTAGLQQYALALSEGERDVLVDILEEALKNAQIEEHRTDALHAKKVVQAHELTIESLLRKARGASPS